VWFAISIVLDSRSLARCWSNPTYAMSMSDTSGDSGCQRDRRDDGVVRVEKHLFARLLYANPVCLLTSTAMLADHVWRTNVMTISWLTPISNNVRSMTRIRVLDGMAR